MRRRLSFALVLALAGCVQAPGALESQDAGAPPELRADCATGRFDATDDGVCARMLGAPPGKDEWEPHLATHPTDPDVVLVSATRFASRGDPLAMLGPVTVWAAITTDGGATWTERALDEPLPLVGDVPGVRRYSFDSINAFGPDGTAYVLFGGENIYAGLFTAVRQQLTVARSTDLGASWSLHRLHESFPALEGDDYMDLAVAPDDGALYVAADTYDALGRDAILLWRSTDQAETWSAPVELERFDGGPRYQFPN